MAKGRGKKPSPKKAKGPEGGKSIPGAAVFPFLAVAVLFAFIGYLLVVPPGRTDRPAKKEATATAERPPEKHLPHLKTEARDAEAALPPTAAGNAAKKPLKYVAIVIDDVGNRKRPVERLLGLSIPLTFSILPGLPNSVELAVLAHNAGQEVMLHLPMEPEEKETNNPGGFALLVSQSEEEIRKAVRDDIAGIPYAVGANNHMGSLFTRREESMRHVLDELKKAGLFFIDSRTTPESAGYGVARELGVKSGYRKIFLDNELDAEAIDGELRRLIKTAVRDGDAIAIGHPHEQTIEALARMIPEFEAEGVRFVHASRLVR